MKTWKTCFCKQGHRESKGGICGQLFKSAGHEECFMCWVKKNPPPLQRNYSRPEGAAPVRPDLHSMR